MLTDGQKRILLKIARDTLSCRIAGGKSDAVDIDAPFLKEKRGVFVTLRQGEELRGCIGSIMPVMPLEEGVREMAMEAALNDPRFPPVTGAELGDIEVEISVLTVPRRVEDAAEIVLGRDGVIVKRGMRQGVFLPQVAEETGWSREEFLGYLCAHKAGLPPDAWKDANTELRVFQAEVFSEGEVK